MDGRRISCHTCRNPGCCYQAVYTQLSFGMVIAIELVKEGRDTPEFRKLLEDQADRMEGMKRDKYFDQGEPCVFLKDGRCSIYRDRPIECRSYFVVTPAKDCLPPTHERLIGSLNMVNVRTGVMGLGRHAHALLGLKETEMRILIGTLPRLVLLGLVLVQDEIGDWREYVRRQPWPSARMLWEMANENDREEFVQLRSR